MALLKGETIPRLELMAALTLASLMTAVHKALACTVKIETVFNWIDSQIVWWWINGESKQFKQFVQNRVTKIGSLWSKEHWGYCPSELNPGKLDERERSSSTWEQLGVFKDEDGVLRCKGRIKNSSLPYSGKFPILLPRKQHFTRLLIAQSHENVKLSLKLGHSSG